MKLLKILLSIYKEENVLNLQESLTKTIDLDKTINLLEKKYSFLPKSMKFEFEKDEKLNFFHAHTYDTDLDSLLNGIIKDANILGWIPTYYTSISNPQAWHKIQSKTRDKPYYFGGGPISIKFEAKFDKEIEKIPSTLYHITPNQNVDKILKIGLVPKSRSKISYHPERVYLSYNLDDIKNLGYRFYLNTKIKNWTVLSIDTDYIVKNNLKLYEDPNYDYGYFTLGVIPPFAIRKIGELDYPNPLRDY